MTITVRFSLKISQERLEQFLIENGKDPHQDNDPQETADLMRQDLEETLPASDYEPFERSDFDIVVEP